MGLGNARRAELRRKGARETTVEGLFGLDAADMKAVEMRLRAAKRPSRPVTGEDPPMISSRLFAYNAADRTFVSELSTVGAAFRRLRPHVPGVGFTMISDRTGRSVEFVECHRESSPDGELQWIDFRPSRPGDRRLNVSVRVFND
jgi:hypothetical protein